MKPIEIAKDIYWVGAVDWNLRDFHGYSTQEGTTYNAYLILDDQVTLIDTVKSEFADELIDNIAQVIDPRKIDWVVSNHTEMDHSGALPRLMHRIGEDKPLICSKVGKSNLSRHFKQAWNYRAVEDGEQLSLGKRTLVFMETRMLHWPDNMFTYCQEDRILFSSDAFGQHLASLARFDDQVGEGVMPHARKYFANILLLYAPLVSKLLEKVTRAGLAIDMICPDHGIIWRKDPSRIIAAYDRWSRQIPKRKALVVYDSMWHSTQKMAQAIVEGLGQAGVEARPMHLRAWHRSDILTEVLDAGAVVVGSPTLNNGLFPTVADFLCYLKGLRPRNKVGAAFGSYGWSGEAARMILGELEAMKFDVIEPAIRQAYVPDQAGLDLCRELGRKVAERLPEG